MDLLRRLAAFALVLFAVACVASWASYANQAAFGIVDAYLPWTAEDLPPNPFFGPLAFAFGSFMVAYMIYPPNERNRDD